MSKNPARRPAFTDAEIQDLQRSLISYDLRIARGKFGNEEMEALEQGFFAPTPEAWIIRQADVSWEFANDLKDHPQAGWKRFTDQMVGLRIAIAVGENNAEFFERIAAFLKCRREGRKPTARDLKMPPQKRGRSGKKHDVRYTYLAAVFSTLRKRMPDFAGEGRTKERIGRQELREAIQNEQRLAGLEDAPLVTEGTLSKWIKEYGMYDFMAELPIAPKNSKRH